jgi:ABC-type multidrug transport system fused ATPase/permease subunit
VDAISLANRRCGLVHPGRTGHFPGHPGLRQSRIAEIPQQPGLFHRTIRENIRYARHDASDLEVVRSARHAHAEEFITGRAEGYDTLVGEQGIQLSNTIREFS